MKQRRVLVGLFAVVLVVTLAGPGARQVLADPVSALLDTAILNAIPPPADDPLLDAAGNPVLDASGNIVSDPKENFHQVKPHDFDPGNTFLVENGWLDGIGCPTKAMIANSNATGTGIMSFSTYMDGGCPTGDPKDRKNEGLLFAKTGPTNNFASAEADLKKVRGITLTELGYDLRKTSPTTDQGSHCGAGAPRFDVITTDGIDHFVGCNTGTVVASS